MDYLPSLKPLPDGHRQEDQRRIDPGYIELENPRWCPECDETTAHTDWDMDCTVCYPKEDE